MISTSLDGVQWQSIEEPTTGEALRFNGNSDHTSMVTNYVPEPILTQFVRLSVVAYSQQIALRWRIRGCPVH